MFSFFKKRKKKKNRFLVVREVQSITHDAVNIVFENSPEIDYNPGQFITVIDSVEDQKVKRAYSLCTSPYVDKYPAITVKRVKNGLMSNHLNTNIKAGDQLEILEPMGRFTTEFDGTNSKHALFIGGGSGITPLLSIIKTMLVREPNSKISLIYGNRSEEDIIFHDMLADLEYKNKERFKIIHILEKGKSEYTGLPTHEMMLEIFEKIGYNKNSEFFICGPEPLLKLAIKSIELGAFKNNKILYESFTPKKSSNSDEDIFNGDQSEIFLTLEGKEYSFTTPKNKPILEIALKNGLDMPYSCQSGICSTCRGKCSEGKVTLDEMEGLSKNELNDNYVLTCVAKPISDVVKIEMD